MEQNTDTGALTAPVMNNKQKSRNGLKITTVIACIVAVSSIGFGAYGMIRGSQKDSQVSDLEAQIKNLEEELSSDNLPSIEDMTEMSEDSSQREDDSGYLKLPKVGLMIPLSQDIIDKISLVDLDNGYRIDVKSIINYREQGYCGNGGSGAIGIVSKENVDIVKEYIGGSDKYNKTKSKWFDTTVAEFNNNVIYPKEYVSFSNLDAVCYDLGDGGTERGQEVAKEVQEINNALETAFMNVKPIK